MPQVYREHDFFIAASLISEGLPLTILEAMASGLVVFSTGTGGGQEIIRHEENGILFAPGDDDGLARALERVIQDHELQRRLSANAIETAREFGIDRVAANIETFLEAVLHKY
jgi:glycosyltransferase involved in cell wall biosynthesis